LQFELEAALITFEQQISQIWSMSVAGQSRHFDREPATSGLPPEADIFGVGRHVSNVP
jgi:hypothetical protein